MFTMTEDPGSSEIGEVFQEAYECEVITWKIPNVSSLEITKSTEIRSPRFFYQKATWTLKMFPYGQMPFGGNFSVKVHLERLDSEVPVHNYFCRYIFKEHKESYCLPSQTSYCAKYDVRYDRVKFDSNLKENSVSSWNSQSWYRKFYHNKSYRWNDKIILVVEILTKKNTTIGLDSETNLTDTTLGPKFDKKTNSLKSYGELFIESFNVNIMTWKIPEVPYITVEVDKKVQSPTFSFAGVSWILKLFLCGQTTFKSKNVDVVIERLPCLIEKHTLSYEISLKCYNENESLTKDYFLHRHSCDRGSFIFDSDHSQENIFNIKSYKEFLNYATSSRQFGTAILLCEFRIPKETEIRLNLQMESLQSFKNTLPLKTEIIRKAEIGEIIKKSFECEVISWTIPSSSSLLTAESNTIGSPQFSYKGAIWILNIYGTSHTKDFSTVVMKRLNSQLPVHNFFYRLFFKEHSREPIFHKSKSFFGSSDEEDRIIWLNNFDNIYLYKNLRHNDMLTLVCELYTEKISLIEMDFKAKSFTAALGNINTESEDSPKSVGELFIETFDVEMITWKIPKARSLPMEVDYGVRSPSFFFAGASWSLEMFPYGQKKFESERNVDVVIERTFSLFPNHPVQYRMYFEDVDEKGQSLKDFGMMLDCSTRGSFIFESNSAKENVCCVKSYSEFFNLVAPNRPSDTAFLVCEFRLKNNDGTNMNIQRKLPKSSTESFATLSEQNSDPSGLTFGESIGNVSEQKPVPSVFAFGESFDNKSERKPFPSGFIFEGSSEKKSEQSTALSVSSSRKCNKKGFARSYQPSKRSSEKNSDGASFVSFYKESFASITEQKPVPLSFTFGESSAKTSEQTPVSFVSSVKGLSENKLDQTPMSFASSSKESPTKMCGQKPVSSSSPFKSSDDTPKESIDLPNKKLLQDFKELFLKQEDCDVVLNVKGQEFAAHRIILKARSSVFASTFRNDMKEKATGTVDIEDCDPSSFSDFLYFLYCGSTEKLSSENVFNLFTTADKYDVQDLRSECLKFIRKNLSVDTFCDTIALALQHSERELIELATDFFSKNLQKIILTVKWQSFLVKNPIQGNELLIKALASNK